MATLAGVASSAAAPNDDVAAGVPGLHIYFTQDDDLFRLGPDDQAPTPLNNPLPAIFRVIVSQVDGTVAYHFDDGGALNIAVVRPDGSTAQLPPLPPDTGRLAYGWSPTRLEFVFVETTGDQHTIWRANADLTEFEPLTGTAPGTRHNQPIWAPDGDTIAFEQDANTPTSDVGLVPREGGLPVFLRQQGEEALGFVAWRGSDVVAIERSPLNNADPNLWYFELATTDGDSRELFFAPQRSMFSGHRAGSPGLTTSGWVFPLRLVGSEEFLPYLVESPGASPEPLGQAGPSMGLAIGWDDTNGILLFDVDDPMLPLLHETLQLYDINNTTYHTLIEGFAFDDLFRLSISPIGEFIYVLEPEGEAEIRTYDPQTLEDNLVFEALGPIDNLATGPGPSSSNFSALVPGLTRD